VHLLVPPRREDDGGERADSWLDRADSAEPAAEVLARLQIESDHEGVGEFRAEVEGPLPSTGANVQDPGRLLERCDIVPAERTSQSIVLHVQAVDLGRMWRHDVGHVAPRMPAGGLHRTLPLSAHSSAPLYLVSP